MKLSFMLKTVGILISMYCEFLFQTQLRTQMVTQTVRVVAPINAAGQNISVTTNRMGSIQNRFVTVSVNLIF